jgi:hypothetical protein
MTPFYLRLVDIPEGGFKTPSGLSHDSNYLLMSILTVNVRLNQEHGNIYSSNNC